MSNSHRVYKTGRVSVNKGIKSHILKTEPETVLTEKCPDFNGK